MFTESVTMEFEDVEISTEKDDRILNLLGKSVALLRSLCKSWILVLLVAVATVASACGQPPSNEGERAAGETTGGEATAEKTTGAETTAETTQQEALTPGEDALVVYSGRSEELVGPVFDQFEERSGIDVQVRYGDTAELAATILEEGENSPADLFFAQDPGALGALQDEGRFQSLPQDSLDRVPERFRSPDGVWIGTSGRARVVAYNTEELNEGDLPYSIFDFTDPRWEGSIGWAPTNGSFQAFVTALRVLEGEDRARAWLEGIQANDPFEYPDNLTAVEGVASGEVQVAFVNHRVRTCQYATTTSRTVTPAPSCSRPDAASWTPPRIRRRPGVFWTMCSPKKLNSTLRTRLSSTL
jgi:iron(III) transport system substrate-binding protein